MLSKSIQLPPFPPPWKPSLRSAKKKRKRQKKQKRQHYFLQKLTSRLNQGALYQYYKTRRCCQSVSQWFVPSPGSHLCPVKPPTCQSLGFSLFRHFVRSAGAERLRWPFCPCRRRRIERKKKWDEVSVWRMPLSASLVVSQAKRGY